MAQKAPGAFKTIGELSAELGVAQHILRYWESKFPQLKPLQRAGNRRYYRPDDVELARRINRLLNDEGYTIRGVQKVLRSRGDGDPPVSSSTRMQAHGFTNDAEPRQPAQEPGVDVARLQAIRDRLAAALHD